MINELSNVFVVNQSFASEKQGARSLPRPVRGPAARPVRARYDAAATNDDNRRHWAFVDGLSANAANSADVRYRLRVRARYESANNSYCRGLVDTLADDLIGTGPRIQILTEDEAFNDRLEKEWYEWSKKIDLAGKLRTAAKAKIVDGEAFGILITNPRIGDPITLDLRLVEADQISTPDLSPTDPNAIDGIVFDDFGNPVEYHLLDSHPGDRVQKPLSYKRLSYQNVIHWYRIDRPGQGRGIPEITAALPLFAMLRRYTLATLAAAETAADFSAILFSDMPPDDADQLAGDPFETIEIQRRMMTTLPAGWKMSQFKSEQPVSTYSEFKREVLNEIARCLGVPFNVAAGNSSGYNYASGRLDHQTYFRSLRVSQAQIESLILDRMFSRWLKEYLLAQNIENQSNKDFSHIWFWDGREHVDPVKEAQADAVRLQSNTTTLADIYARQGGDWRTKLRQRGLEVAFQREIGLVTENPGSEKFAEDRSDNNADN